MTTKGNPGESDSTGKIIDILVVIDTDYIKANYASIHGIKDQDKGNPYAIDHHSEYVVAAGANNITKQGTADITFNAKPNDRISFRGVSAYNNSDDAIIIYGIIPANSGPKGNVFNPFHYDMVTRAYAVVPVVDSSNSFNTTTTSITFYSYNSTVQKQGTESYIIQFALYTLAEDGETQKLYGYYQWDPTIYVS